MNDEVTSTLVTCAGECRGKGHAVNAKGRFDTGQFAEGRQQVRDVKDQVAVRIRPQG